MRGHGLYVVLSLLPLDNLLRDSTFALSILAHEMTHALAAVAVNPKGRCHEMGMLLPIPAFYVSYMSPDETPFMQFVVSSVGIHANWLFALLFLLLAVPDTPFCSALMFGSCFSYVTGILNLVPGGILVSHDGTRMLEALLHPKLGSPLHLLIRFLLGLVGIAVDLALFAFSILPYIMH